MATLGFTDWLSMIGTFSVVLVLLVLTLVMLKKMGPNLGNANGKRIQVLEAHNLGARQRLLLISVNQKQILMAMSPNGITKLDHFDSTKIAEDMQSEELQSDVSSDLRKSFKDIVSQVIKK
jgi:flagellar biosynthetic protein FliO